MEAVKNQQEPYFGTLYLRNKSFYSTKRGDSHCW